MVKWSVKKYQSVTGSPEHYLMSGETEVAIKSYDKIVKIKDEKLFKEFLKDYPREIENLSDDLKNTFDKPATDSEVIKANNLTGKEAANVKAGKKGGLKTAMLGKHKGHKTKKGLVQDQNKISKEVHEKHYRKNKVKKNLKNNSCDHDFEIRGGDDGCSGSYRQCKKCGKIKSWSVKNGNKK